jgi:hypothetical protein
MNDCKIGNFFKKDLKKYAA